MKHFLMLFFVALLGLTAFTEKNTDTVLTGKVSDEHGEKLIGAIIKIMKDTTLVKGIITDFEGNYRVAIAPGTYTLEFSYTGYESKRITDVRVLPGTGKHAGYHFK
ncbi:MAG: carboxypeptidase regulatory-like domain-containing protein [Lewinellaceae bacterium]|nr:carboxypeptidase regulatory-like domain-containing protein [Lewinellaceae bacterium]